MSEEKARIKISIYDGNIEIEGSEDFVKSQIEVFKEVIVNGINKLQSAVETKKSTSSNSEDSSVNPKNLQSHSTSDAEISFLDQYSDVYVLDESDLKIVCDIPGKSDPQKTLNIALLYAFGKKQMGIEEVLVNEIREICKIHGCFNQSNFSTHIKNGDPKLYLDKGSGNSRTIKIIRPGEKKVLEILDEIRSGS